MTSRLATYLGNGWNGTADGDWPSPAQALAQTRRRERPLVRKLDDPELNEYIRVRLARHWSPEQIAGRRRLEAPTASRRQRVNRRPARTGRAAALSPCYTQPKNFAELSAVGERSRRLPRLKLELHTPD